MPRTITDDEYNFLQNKRMTADFVESIYNDPQLNKEAKRLIKRKYPNLSIPDFDIEEKVNARLDSEKKARDDAERNRRPRRPRQPGAGLNVGDPVPAVLDPPH